MGIGLNFWGVRGSIACPSPNHVKFGGNTSCVEITAGDERIVLDAGTGLRELGNQFLRDDVRRATLLLTHTHWDHINGFPFFKPAYMANRRFRIMAGHLNSRGVRDILSGQMAEPTFPVPLEAMRAELDFEDFAAGDSFDLVSGVHVRTAKLNHPNRATGYRIEHAGKAVCYVTDTEHVIGKQDQAVGRASQGALGHILNHDAVGLVRPFERIDAISVRARSHDGVHLAAPHSPQGLFGFVEA